MSDQELEILAAKILERPTEQIVKSCHVVHLPPKDEKGKRFIVNLLNSSYSLEVERCEVVELISGKKADEKVLRLILKYLANCESSKTKESLLPLDKFQGGSQLQSELNRRAVRPLIENFGYDAQGFETACKSIGGKKEKLGGISYSFDFFPKFKVLLQLWVGDSESYKQPATNFMFTSIANQLFTAKDLVDAAEILVSTLIESKHRRLSRLR